jgi:hypothetical protein
VSLLLWGECSGCGNISVSFDCIFCTQTRLCRMVDRTSLFLWWVGWEWDYVTRGVIGQVQRHSLPGVLPVVAPRDDVGLPGSPQVVGSIGGGHHWLCPARLVV